MSSSPLLNLPAKERGSPLSSRSRFPFPYMESDAESGPGVFFGVLMYGFLIAFLIYLVRAIVRAFAKKAPAERH